MEAKKLVGVSPSFAPTLSHQTKEKLIGAQGILIFSRDSVFWRSSSQNQRRRKINELLERQSQMARSRPAGRSIRFGIQLLNLSQTRTGNKTEFVTLKMLGKQREQRVQASNRAERFFAYWFETLRQSHGSFLRRAITQVIRWLQSDWLRVRENSNRSKWPQHSR